MAEKWDALRRGLIGAAEAGTVADLGSALSAQLGRVVPHQGYILTGVDPASGTACFHTREYGYGAAAARRLIDGGQVEPDPFSSGQPLKGPDRVAVLSAEDPRYRHSFWAHEVMAYEGVGSELRIALADGRSVWGQLWLLRGLDSRPFSPAEAGHARRLADALATATRRYVTGRPLRIHGLDRTPGVLVVDAGGRITSSTPSVGQWRDQFTGAPRSSCEGEFESLIWSITQTAALQPGGAALARVPTLQGWATLTSQPLQGTGPGAAAVTIRPASGLELLPAVTAWHGLTFREGTVVEHALEGLSAKQIARRLSLSPHTVNDHFKAIYRKIGVHGRDELIARLAH
ncbi:LuxR C-terminal-related transcriptional regulator [Actinomadura terrae]|uniref:LuxR C-terminal-related transcriptional regulator n=1 Tax=Actinomadura terrae TaxID=604353 RepID=UPI001FA70F3E|nr:LuxR C-terminal-related transcriptional regulator [Actinomadura terrae]